MTCESVIRDRDRVEVNIDGEWVPGEAMGWTAESTSDTPQELAVRLDQIRTHSDGSRYRNVLSQKAVELALQKPGLQAAERKRLLKFALYSEVRRIGDPTPQAVHPVEEKLRALLQAAGYTNLLFIGRGCPGSLEPSKWVFVALAATGHEVLLVGVSTMQECVRRGFDVTASTAFPRSQVPVWIVQAKGIDVGGP